MPETAGELVSSTGDVIGHHEGISNFTVGQRKGLKVSSPSPLYVLNIDPASHRVTVGADAELATSTLRANRLNWISIPDADSADAREGQDPPSARARLGNTGARRPTPKCSQPSMSRSARSRRGSRPFSTTATKWWAAAGSSERISKSNGMA